jgi:uncharacterized NAD(P)/FAD-binding protein YdhS
MTMPGKSFQIAIIGGGFSGSVLAAQLLRQGHPSVSIILIEREASPGKGVAYGTKFGQHLLNVRAQSMSAFAHDPAHFVNWLRSNYQPNVQPTDFVPRRVYGRYVESLLREAAEQNPGRFQWKKDEAVSITPLETGARIGLRSGPSISADKIVLALGNFPPADLRFPGKTESSPRYVPNPWSMHALEGVAQKRVAQGESVLLVGSGLTSVDVGIALRERGFTGAIHMLSRHGFLPQPHKAADPWPAFWDDAAPRTARGLLRLIRNQVRQTPTPADDWRAVIDSLRPSTQKIWQLLPPKEQRRFLRHLRTYWDVHRHRVAPQIGNTMTAEMDQHTIQLHAGRITEYREDEDGVTVTYRNRGDGESKRLQVGRVINCTGPDGDFRRMNDPLLNNLLRQELVRPDPLFLGLETAPDGALIAADGKSSSLLYTLGPLRKGTLWESTAVPELRVQAAELAQRLNSLANPPQQKKSEPRTPACL